MPQTDLDDLMIALARLDERLKALTATVSNVAQQQREQAVKVRWVMAAAAAVVGLVGGPDAVAAMSGAAA